VRLSNTEPVAESVRVFVPAGSSPHTESLQPDAHIETDRRVSNRERNIALKSALKGGAIAAALCLFPMGIVLAMPLAGFLAVLFYGRQSWRAEPSRRSGFRLGALAGIFGFVIFAGLAAIIIVASGDEDEFRRQSLEALQRAHARYSDPQQLRTLEYLMTPQGLTIGLAVSVVLIGTFFVLLSGVGGAVSASILRRKGPPS
jgi:MFS family permease